MILWLAGILVVLTLGGVAAVAAGFGGQMAPAEQDRRPLDLPDGPIGAADLRQVRLNVAVRGYRMDEVDDLLARLADQIEGPPVASADIDQE
ncbi:MAG TPA: DivIVA domain-containing protein [Nocardioides sp.]|nr:DivIVA domain-containing protein [Nocardioides sp.]